jgi:hypothetical protein
MNVPWEVTPSKAAVKIMSWQKINELKHIEDPQQEVAAMQFISKEVQHPHVMGVLDVLYDDEYLLMFMPFCSSGDLFGFVQQAGRFPEQMARYWFRQILEVSVLLLSVNVKQVVCKTDQLWYSIDLFRDSLICNEWAFVTATCPWRIVSKEGVHECVCGVDLSLGSLIDLIFLTPNFVAPINTSSS